MKRKHTALEYKNMIRKVRSVRPDISVTSDFIIGYPGETENHFQETLDLISDIEFDDGYSFIYSKRPGTIASSEIDNVSLEEKKERLSKVQNLLRKNSEKYLSQLVNTKQRILVEGKSKKTSGELYGRTFTNKIVRFIAPDDLVGKSIEVEILKANRSSLYGCI
jgi:tRNA-2-methylthio-N6-dimethylallyladenosine synthase